MINKYNMYTYILESNVNVKLILSLILDNNVCLYVIKKKQENIKIVKFLEYLCFIIYLKIK